MSLFLKTALSAFLVFFLSCLFLQAQDRSKDTWDTYIAQYDSGAGSVTLDMDLIKDAPVKAMPYILITGVTYSNCNNNGFPAKEEFNHLYKISDDGLALVQRMAKPILAGTFTYRCQRLDYIYLDDTLAVRQKLATLYREKYPDYKYYIKIIKDEGWEAYRGFLYPNDTTKEYMANEKVLMGMAEKGDDGKKARIIDHWIYFKTAEDRSAFISEVKKEGFDIKSADNISAKDNRNYQLRISRKDKASIDEITAITLHLKALANKYKGDYDGWESPVEK